MIVLLYGIHLVNISSSHLAHMVRYTWAHCLDNRHV